MKKIIWQAEISAIGEQAALFLEEKRLVLFSDRAPKDIIDYCVVHREGELIVPLATDQYLEIFDMIYPITAVGGVASHNLAELGHITLLFDGGTEPELPGTVHLLGEPPCQLQVQGNITVFAKH